MGKTSRRELLGHMGSGAAMAAVAPMINVGRYGLFARARAQYSARAIELVGDALVVDMLSPLWLNIPMLMETLGDPSGLTEEEARRFVDSGIDVFHIAVGLGGPDPIESVLQWVAGWNGLIAEHPDWFTRIDSAADLEAARHADTTGILIGVQNSEHFLRPDDVDRFHGLGQRVSQLTYNSRNRIGNGSTERVDGGLSDFGVAIVERMNRVGMAVDVSHSGDRTTLDACEVSERPVLFTHTNCRALVPGHPRCKTDEAIVKMAETGGVLGITGVRMFVRAEEPTTIEHALDHYDHVRDLVGAQHLGIGSDIDLDGYDDLPAETLEGLRSGYKDSYAFRDKIDIEGLDHPKRVFDLTEGLIRRGYSDQDITGILGANFQRVLDEIWRG